MLVEVEEASGEVLEALLVAEVLEVEALVVVSAVEVLVEVVHLVDGKSHLYFLRENLKPIIIFHKVMKKLSYLVVFLVLISCQSFGDLTLLGNLPNQLEEVSGTEVVANSDFIWMLNDSGNKSEIYRVSYKGKIKKTISIKAKNHDWEDLTSDNNGNLYIGDFGNNANKRKNLVILKVAEKDLSNKKAAVERIEFEYPNQKQFPPKKKHMYFDTESFFYFKEALYLFTKSRVKGSFGKTSVYKIPAKKGKYTAVLLGEYENCKELACWITSADISPNEKKVVLLSQKNISVFSDFKGDDFFKGKLQKIALKHRSQKEGIAFKNNNTLLITDEKAQGAGGNLYELKLN
jgi:hypothetical protein